MKPGRELDALIQEQVFGYTHTTRKRKHRSKGLVDVECWMKGDHLMWSPEPYSTDISAAWEVVEKLKTDFAFELSGGNHGNGTYQSMYPYRDHSRRWTASLHTHTGGPTILDVKIERASEEKGETPAHAICLAALKAVSDKSIS